jgi:hypothetical protein
MAYGVRRSMQRGINFTIYAVLTCVILHLVRVSFSARTALAHSLQFAINSPDPELTSDARDYFTRHMRILEKCIDACPTQELKAQIFALCDTFFSVDKDKPFQFKASISSGTPSDSYQGHDSYPQPSSQSFPLQAMTPLISAVSRDFGPSLSEHSCVDVTRWNPIPTFQQWNTAFPIPAVTLETQPSPPAKPLPYCPKRCTAYKRKSPVSPTPYVTQYPASAGGSNTSTAVFPAAASTPTAASESYTTNKLH